MKRAAQELERVFRQQIPLTVAMDVRVTDYDGRQLRLEAPVEHNRNHKNTAFGGSLYALGALCGWGLLQLALRAHGLEGHIVIHEGHMRYERPVTDRIQATCTLPEAAELERFLDSYRRRGKARISLTTQVNDGAATLKASYVVHR